jgi:hypothetical protein
MQRWIDAPQRSFRGLLAVQKKCRDLDEENTAASKKTKKQLCKAVSVFSTGRDNPLYGIRFGEPANAVSEWLHTILLGSGPYAKKLVRRAFEGEEKKFKAQAGGNEAIAEIETTLGQISHPAPRSGLTTFPKGFRSWPKMTGKQNFDLISYLPIAMALSPKADRWAALRSAVAEIAYMHVQVSKMDFTTSTLGANMKEVHEYAEEVINKKVEERWMGEQWADKIWVGAELDDMPYIELSDEEDELNLPMPANAVDEEDEGGMQLHANAADINRDDDSDYFSGVEEERSDGSEVPNNEGDMRVGNEDELNLPVPANAAPVPANAAEGYAADGYAADGNLNAIDEEEKMGMQLLQVMKGALDGLAREMTKVNYNWGGLAKPGECMQAIKWQIALHGAWVYACNGARFERDHKSLNLVLRCINWARKLLSVTWRLEEWEIVRALTGESIRIRWLNEEHANAAICGPRQGRPLRVDGAEMGKELSFTAFNEHITMGVITANGKEFESALVSQANKMC